MALAAKLEMPALTIVGPVVSLREHLRWFESLPLFGKRVLITRPDGQSEDFAEALRDLGAEPVELPTIRIAAASDPSALNQAIQQVERYDWLVFTSVNGVRYFFAALDQSGGDARKLARAKIAAIGPATARELKRHGVRADCVPDEYRGEAVAVAMRTASPTLRGLAVLLARAEVARDALPNLLRESGAQVDVVSSYRTLEAPAETLAQIAERLRAGSIDIATFTSPSTVDRLFVALGAEAAALLERVTLAAIGPITAQAMEARGLKPHVVASSYTAQGLVEALCAHVGAPVAKA
jgi:uroporphyrinogen III methyltransferase/synthase